EQSAREGDLQFCLAPTALVRVRELLELCNRALEMGDCLFVRRARYGLLAGPSPPTDGGCGPATFRPIEGKHLGRTFPGPFPPPLRDPGVNLLALAAQQAAISRIPHQRVFEAVDPSWMLAAREDQLGGGKMAERLIQSPIIEARCRRE